jgi:hypothetical protein
MRMVRLANGTEREAARERQGSTAERAAGVRREPLIDLHAGRPAAIGRRSG